MVEPANPVARMYSGIQSLSRAAVPSNRRVQASIVFEHRNPIALGYAVHLHEELHHGAVERKEHF